MPGHWFDRPGDGTVAPTRAVRYVTLRVVPPEGSAVDVHTAELEQLDQLWDEVKQRDNGMNGMLPSRLSRVSRLSRPSCAPPRNPA